MANELKYTLDTSRKTISCNSCKQYDDRTLILTLLSAGQPYVVTGATITLNAKKPDGTFVVQTTNITIASNVVTIVMDDNITRVAGDVNLELKTTLSGKDITTFTFILSVEPSVIQPNDLQSSTVITAVQDLNNKIALATSTGNTVINNINAVKKTLDASIANGDTADMRVDIDTLNNSVVNPNLVINGSFDYALYNWGINGGVTPTVVSDAIYGSMLYFNISNNKSVITQSLTGLSGLITGNCTMSAILKATDYTYVTGIGFVVYYTDSTISDYTWSPANGAILTDLGNGYKKIVITSQMTTNKVVKQIDVRLYTSATTTAFQMWVGNVKLETGKIATAFVESFQPVIDPTLTTTSKYVAGAINEHDAEIGILSGLTTTAKTNIVVAVNEVNTNKENKATTNTNITGSIWYVKYPNGRLEMGGALGVDANGNIVGVTPNVGNPATIIDMAITLPLATYSVASTKMFANIAPLVGDGGWSTGCVNCFIKSTTQAELLVVSGLATSRPYVINWRIDSWWKAPTNS